MKLDFVNYENDFDENAVITNPEGIVKRKGTAEFTETGIYSERIFGKMHGESVEYACECGNREGKYLQGCLCDKCGTRVERRESSIDKMGWIDLGDFQIIKPIFYSFFEKLVGKSAFDRMIRYDRRLSLNGDVIVEDEGEFTKVDDFNNLGLMDFIENVDAVLEFFGRRTKNKKVYELLLANRENLFTSKVPVVSHRLRPAIMRGDDIQFDKINNVYSKLINSSKTLNEMSDQEMLEIAVLPILYNTQMQANLLHESHLEAIKGKGGWLRSNLMANRLNFTARMVIVPNPVEMELDEISIPYLAAVEMLRFHIINVLIQLRGVSYIDAQNIWADACLDFNEDIYMIIQELMQRTKGGLHVLLNRNPTISLGSMLKMRIGEVKRDYHDYTMGVPNGVLKFLGGDYDGDVLSIFLLLDRDLIEHYEKFNPKRLIVSNDNGRFNGALAIDKDNALGLFSMIS